MTQVIYDFNNVCVPKFTNYICQLVSKRKLSNIYHSHTFYELIIMLNGSCNQIINDKSYYCEKDTLIILRPNEFHSFTSQSDDINIISLSVQEDEFNRFCGAYEKWLANKIEGAKNPIIIHYADASSDLTVKCGSIFSHCDEYECKFLLSLLIKHYIDYLYKEQTSIPQNLSFALSQMKKPENIKLGIPEFIKLSNYSRTQLSRLMKKHLNTTIHEYILNLKLDYAYNALILTDDTVEEIAENAGYASASHFNKIFKQKFKTTPAALRKNHGIRTV